MTATESLTGHVTGIGRVKQVLASVVLLIATIGVPAGLSVSVGWPLPTTPSALERLPLLLSQPLASSAVVDVLAVIAWLAWFHFTAGVVVELVNATTRRGRLQLRLPFGGPSHDLARSLVVTALLVGVASPFAGAPLSVAAAAPVVSSAPTVAGVLDGGSLPVSASATAPVSGLPTGSSLSERVGAHSDPGGPGATLQYVVPAPAAGRYACLWDIAEQQLGDGTRWTEIHTLNVGRTQPDGQTLTDPDLIHPGWRLVLPAHTRPTPGNPATALAVGGGHVVAPGDTLWDIADEHLGDGARYDELAAAATTITQPDGRTLTDPDLLLPGWTIPLPTDPVPTDPVPTDPVPTDPLPTDPVPTDPVPADPLPTDPVPTGTAPSASSGTGDPPPPGEALAVESLRNDAAPNSADDSSDRNDPPGVGGLVVADTPPGQEEAADIADGTETGRDRETTSDPADRGRGSDLAGGGDRAVAGEAEETNGSDSPSWSLAGLSGAGTMLAGALLLLLQQVRRRESRQRRPGRAPATPDPQHALTEMTVRAHAVTATSIERLDQILRRLAASCVSTDDPLPAVTTVTLDRSGVTLHLAHPRPPTAGWSETTDSRSWHLPGDVDLEQTGPFEPEQPAPFPLLVTVGVSPDGATTMLNLEYLGAATLTGNRQRGEDFLRYVAAELGCNPWSENALVHCIGVAEELGPLNPDRIHVSTTTMQTTHAPADHDSALRETAGTTGTEPEDAAADRTYPLGVPLTDAGFPDSGTGDEGTVDSVLADAVASVDRSVELGVEVPDARIRQAGDETWPPRVVLIDASRRPNVLAALADLIHRQPVRTATTVLVLAAPHDPRTGDLGTDRITLHVSDTGQLTLGGAAASGEAVALGQVSAVALSAGEAQGCAALHALGPADAPMPSHHDVTDGWRAYADVAGALATRHVLPRVETPSARVDTTSNSGVRAGLELDVNTELDSCADGTAGGQGVGRIPRGDLETEDWQDTGAGPVRGGNDRANDGGDDGGDDGGNDGRGAHDGAGEEGGYESGAAVGRATVGRGEDRGPADGVGEAGVLPDAAESVLGARDEDYLRVAATTGDDLAVLAPRVPVDVRRRVAASDPGLDEDVAQWFSRTCTLPRLTLLGPVGARTRGVPVTKRKPYYTELLAFIATRPHGATPEEVAAAFDISVTKARGYVGTVREWLGTNPRTGRAHVPDARHSPAAEDRGVAAYEVQDLLVDVDLFRRLRLRGQTRGPDGIRDLQRALTLVTGPPFSKLRPGGWTWLVEGDRLDQHLLCAVVDVAHLVTTHLLHAGDLVAARATAELAALAAPEEEIPRLDLAAVAVASGHHHVATDLLQGGVCNRSDDAGPPEELSARTHEILQRHGWLTDPRKAAS